MNEEPSAKRYRMNTIRPADSIKADPYHPNVSKVVHVRNLSDKATEADLIEALCPFGPIAYATCLPNTNMGLVEFETIDEAKRCVLFAQQNNRIMVAGTPALFNYSTSESIGRTGLQQAEPNKILVIIVLNATFPIDCEVIHKICSPHGKVLRIVIFRRTLLQILVEFEDKVQARAAKLKLNGADIYSGCCTLKVEFARGEEVRITDSEDGKDYTLEDSSTGERHCPLLVAPMKKGTQPTGYDISSYDNDNYGAYSYATGTVSLSTSGSSRPSEHPLPPPDYRDNVEIIDPYAKNPNATPLPPVVNENWSIHRQSRGDTSWVDRHAGHRNSMEGAGSPYGPVMPARAAFPFLPQRGYGYERERAPRFENGYGYGYGERNNNPYFAEEMSAVVMMYGRVKGRLNCEHVFNLLCCYGNVNKVKFLRGKDEIIMVEMANGEQAARVCHILDIVDMCGVEVRFRPSKQTEVAETGAPFELHDGTASMVNFTGSRNQRFLAKHGTKSHVTAPTDALFYFNAPLAVKEEHIQQLFAAAGAPRPKKVTIEAARSNKSMHGVLYFECISDATTALVLANHIPIDSDTGPYTFKMAYYSRPQHQHRGERDEQRRGGGRERREDRGVREREAKKEVEEEVKKEV